MQGLAITTAFAMHRCGQQAAKAVALDAFREFDVGEGEGLAERVGNWGVGTRTAGALVLSAGLGCSFDILGFGLRHREEQIRRTL